MTKLGLPPDKGGFENDPVLGLVENLGLHGWVLDGAKVYVGILAATILFIATNAGVIGASRITYSMASYRQLPEVFRRLHPRFKTPWLSLVVFAGRDLDRVLLPGKVDFLGTMYSFGAMLSFTIAHASIIALRRKPAEPGEFRARPNLRIGGLDIPLFAVFGGLGTAIAWVVVVVQYPPARWAGLGWLAIGFLFYWQYRRRVVHRGLRETVRAPVLVRRAVADRGVPDDRRPREAHRRERGGARRRRAARGRARRDRRDRARDRGAARAPARREAARGGGRGRGRCSTTRRRSSRATASGRSTRLLRARRAGPAIVDEARRRDAELVVLGAPRRAVAGRPPALRRHGRLRAPRGAVPRARRRREERWHEARTAPC